MKTNELKAERVRQGKTRKYMACLIKKGVDTYTKKENGKVKFTTDEVVTVANDLDFTFDKFNDIFFDGKLPYGNLGIKESS